MSRSEKPFDEALWEASDGSRLIDELQDLSRQIRLLEAQRLDVVAEMDRQGIASLAGYRSTRALLVDATRIAPAQAAKLVARAQAVTETLTPTGHVTPAPLPTVRQALHEGLIDGEHIDAIARTLKQLPDMVELGARELVESTLAETSRTENPTTVQRHGDVFVQHLDQDGAESIESTQPTNSFAFTRALNGAMTFRGRIGADTAELFEQLLDKGAKPTEGDTRAPDERYGDAFADLVHQRANPRGGARAHLTVLLDYNTLIDGIGTAKLESGCPLGPKTIRRLACDADFIPMVLNGESVPLDAGRSRRLVKPKQRAALVARDRGCAFPGCCNPARWADAHHIKHWLDGGETNVDNMVLLCRRHHLQLHESEWKVRMADGLPEFIPPKWIDARQQPLRNRVHHLRP